MFSSPCHRGRHSGTERLNNWPRYTQLVNDRLGVNLLAPEPTLLDFTVNYKSPGSGEWGASGATGSEMARLPGSNGRGLLSLNVCPFSQPPALSAQGGKQTRTGRDSGFICGLLFSQLWCGCLLPAALSQARTPAVPRSQDKVWEN